jgi:hypothetical protein
MAPECLLFGPEKYLTPISLAFSVNRHLNALSEAPVSPISGAGEVAPSARTNAKRGSLSADPPYFKFPGQKT